MPPRSRVKNAIADAGAKAGDPTKPPDGASPAPEEPKETTDEALARMRFESRILMFRSRLAAPFPPAAVKFLPRNVKANRCLAMPYIDARLVEDRLDDVVGPGGWSDAYELVSNGSVVCKLSVLCVTGDGIAWVTKCDVGSPSEQPDMGDKLKAAFSDALKRAAVKFGIGRYLYRCPPVWCDYDPVKKQITQKPHLPAFALPKVAPSDTPMYHGDYEDLDPPVATVASPPPAPASPPASPPPPAASANGKKKSDTEVIEEQIAEWNKRLVACDTPDDLNALKPLIKKIPDAARGPVWKYILDSVCADPVNWRFDEEKKVFVDDAPPGDAIPF